MSHAAVRIAAILLAVGVAVPTIVAEPPSQNTVPLSEGKKARRERQEKEREAQKDNSNSNSNVQSFRRQTETPPETQLSLSVQAAVEKAGKEKQDQFLAKYDTDHDGKISPEEWRAVDPEGLTFDAFMAERFKTLPEAGKAELTKKWDTNGDGRLDEKEVAAWRTQWQAERMALLARFDTDKDGKLNDAERKAMVEALKAKRDEKADAKPEAKPQTAAVPTGDKK